MIWVDYCVIAVFAISTLIGILRGFTREVLGILTWVFAAWLAWAFGDNVAPMLQQRIDQPELRQFCAAAALFLGGLCVAALATHLMSIAVRASLLSSTDRTLGGGFGMVRAMLFVAAFVLIAGAMGAAQERWWRESVLLPRFGWLAGGLAGVVPPAWLELLKPGAAQPPQDASPAPDLQGAPQDHANRITLPHPASLRSIVHHR